MSKTRLDWLELPSYSANPTDTDAGYRGLAAVGTSIKFWNGTSWVTLEEGTQGDFVAVVVTPTAATTAIDVVGVALTTGKGLDMSDLNALTSGIGVHVASSATAITGAGRLVYVNHTGATSTSGILSEFASAANDETVILKVTASAANALGTAFEVSSATTTGNAIKVTANSLTSGKALSVTASSASTDGGTSFETALFSTTMTGAAGVGGRVRAYMTTNVALGAWSNAFKGEVTYGASGSTSGLGSSILAEMTLSAGTSAGNYALVEGELNLASGALTGTATSLIYLSVNGADAATFSTTNGFIMNLQGLTAGASNVFRTGLTAATINAATTAALQIKVGSTTYFIPLATATA